MYALHVIPMCPDACKKHIQAEFYLFFLNPVEKQLTWGNNGRFHI